MATLTEHQVNSNPFETIKGSEAPSKNKVTKILFEGAYFPQLPDESNSQNPFPRRVESVEVVSPRSTSHGLQPLTIRKRNFVVSVDPTLALRTDSFSSIASEIDRYLQQALGSFKLEKVATIDPLEIANQIEDMKKLQDGWFDGRGSSFSPDGLDWLAGKLQAHYSRALPQIYLYPGPEGKVHAEWSLNAYEVGIEIDLCSHQGEWDYINVHTHESSEGSLDLDDDDSWTWLVHELQQLRVLKG